MEQRKTVCFWANQSIGVALEMALNSIRHRVGPREIIGLKGAAENSGDLGLMAHFYAPISKLYRDVHRRMTAEYYRLLFAGEDLRVRGAGDVGPS